MSQIYKSATGSSPAIPTSFDTQNGTAVPLANTLIINGEDSRENNDNGIITKGGVIATGTVNEVDVVITNRITGSVTTTGSTTSPMVTFTPTVVGVYTFEARISAFNITSNIGAGYSLVGTIRFQGGVSTLCGTPDKIENEEGTMIQANLTMTVSGADAFINGVGYQLVGVDQVINWSVVGLYTFVGV